MRGKHQSLAKELKKTIQWLERIPEVKKIIIGLSHCCRHRYRPGFIKVRGITSAGLKANGYSGNGLSDLFIRIEPTTAIEKVKKNIENKFPS